jgi:hypothetical protein
MDARDFHVYAAEWTPEQVAFVVDYFRACRPVSAVSAAGRPSPS